MTVENSPAITEAEAAWERVQLARHPQRPSSLYYIRYCLSDFIEFHGDRLFADDPQMIGGWASIDGQTVMVIGHQKNTKVTVREQRDGKELYGKANRPYSHPFPEGFRKAQRLAEQAERFAFPLITFIDTPGADPSLESEKRGQALAIAQCIERFTRLKTLIIPVIIGQGGSGGALAIGVGDRVLMMENAIYTVASPEAAAAILWRDSSKAAEAASTMKITAQDMFKFGIVDEIIAEPPGGAHTDPLAAAGKLRESITRALVDLQREYYKGGMLEWEKLLDGRYNKYRKIGVYSEHESCEQKSSP